MKKRKIYLCFVLMLMLGVLTSACDQQVLTPTSTPKPPPDDSEIGTSQPENPVWEVSFAPGEQENGLSLGKIEDADVEVVDIPNESRQGWRTGNGVALPAEDNNTAPDGYIQFSVRDDILFEGNPTSRVVIEIEYLDEGTDSFLLQYDSPTDPFTDGFSVFKEDSGKVKTITLPLCNIYFGNRNNGYDFRISDDENGSDTILRVTVRLVKESAENVTINVDSCGANPYGNKPDSEAIQTCISQACDGDIIRFTSGVADQDYKGYLVDKTIFLVYPILKSDLTFESTDSSNHALLQATADLKGFVVRLLPRFYIGSPGLIDNMTFHHLDIDGNRTERVCIGDILPNQEEAISDGINDNAGSWLLDCTEENITDAYCSPGSLALDGGVDTDDPAQDYLGNPDLWSTNFVVQDVVISNTECGTAFGFSGANFLIDSVTIDVSGEHTHAPDCELTDSDDPVGAWGDGITYLGPAHRLTNNLVMDASDIGMVSFGGRDVFISNNTILARPGNHGMFAGIAMHPNTLGDIGGLEISKNRIINEADPICGGIHAGINLGVHTWANGCMNHPSGATYGVAEDCSNFSPAPQGSLCDTDTYCRTWGHIPEGKILTLRDNYVEGTQVGYIISGLDVLGDLDISGNEVESLHLTDWEGDRNCEWEPGYSYNWGVIDFVAFDPPLDGWEEQLIFCLR